MLGEGLAQTSAKQLANGLVEVKVIALAKVMGVRSVQSWGGASGVTSGVVSESAWAVEWEGESAEVSATAWAPAWVYCLAEAKVVALGKVSEALLAPE